MSEPIASPRLGFTAGLGVTVGLAVAMTAVIALPVLISPAERIFGSGSYGRQADPFIVMLQIGGRVEGRVLAQPVTDGLGWLLARWLSPVAAYNVLVLMTFPLAAAAAYALSRYLFDSLPAAIVSALLFAFAPVHLAHASYHVHIAQVQWLPLYVLALFGAVDRPAPMRLLGLVLAASALVLSNSLGRHFSGAFHGAGLKSHPTRLK